MKALVLTCDRYVKVTEHMLYTYEFNWPKNPFEFIVPYNETYPNNLKRKFGEKITFIKTHGNIKPTVKSLIKDIDDEEMIYWCIDDKYLRYINIQEMNNIIDYLGENKKINGIQPISRNSCIDKSKNIEINKNKFYKRSSYKKIWLHQFLKRKVLKHLFDNMPDEFEQAKHMDYWVREVIKFPFNNMYVADKNIISIGESVRRGGITDECKKSMRKYDMEIPKNPKKILKG